MSSFLTLNIMSLFSDTVYKNLLILSLKNLIVQIFDYFLYRLVEQYVKMMVQEDKTMQFRRTW